jgi:CheY-like chemotaxis protein
VIGSRQVSIVLLVEDEPDLREMMSVWLQSHRIETRVASHGLAALAAVRQHPRPALILLDLMMPVMDGWEFRRRQLADPTIAHIPVVVTSAVAQHAGRALQAAAILPKPYEFDELLAAVRKFV